MKLHRLPLSLLGPFGAAALPALALLATSDLRAQGAALAGSTAPASGDRDDLSIRTEAPPMMVLVEAGYAVVGTKTATLRDLLDGKFGHQVKMDLAAQNPGERVRVEEFQIQAVEISNRQYLEFVRATGHRPPLGWGRDAVQEAQRAHQVKEEERKKEAAAKGNDFTEMPFQPVDWWNNNWQTVDWAIPAGEEDFPVTFVSLRDCEAFCDWAGVRLPTEAEWIRAARGESDQEYVSGDKYLADRSLNVETSNAKLRAVSTTGESRTESGIFDLPGSVYEWTTSPYAELKGYKDMKFGRTKSEEETIDPKFDPDARVLKGGSFSGENPRFATRVAHRVKAPTYAVSPMLGFRIVRTPKFGVDHIENLLARHVDTSSLGGPIAASKGIGEESWMVEPSTGAPNVESYGIIKAHEYVIFAPTAEIEHVTASSLYSASQKEPVTLGILTTSENLTQPALPAGTYIVRYRGAGKLREEKKEEGEKAPKGLNKKEREKLEEEAAKKKAEEEALEKARKEAEEKHKQDVESGVASSLQDREEAEVVVLAEDVEWDPDKENLFFVDVKTGAIAQKIESSSSPFDFVKEARNVTIRHELEPVAEVTTEKGKVKSPALRRLHIAIPTRAAKTHLVFQLDLNARPQ